MAGLKALQRQSGRWTLNKISATAVRSSKFWVRHFILERD